MKSILGIGECMVEMSPAGAGLWKQAFAGDVFNALWYARALSGEDVTVGFHTALGSDPLSDQMLNFIGSAGIDCTYIPRIADRRPGLYSIHLKGAERSFTYWRDTSAARMMMMHPEMLWPKIEKADVIYLSGITLAILPNEHCEMLLTQLHQRKSGAAMIVFDPNIRPNLWQDRTRMLDVIAQAASLSDIVLPSFDDEAGAFADPNPKSTAQRYRALGADHVVVKDGPADIIHLQSGIMTCFPVAPVANVIDTTAAGDSFNGAYIASMLVGCSTAKAIESAQQCAGSVIQHKGALLPVSKLNRTP